MSAPKILCESTVAPLILRPCWHSQPRLFCLHRKELRIDASLEMVPFTEDITHPAGTISGESPADGTSNGNGLRSGTSEEGDRQLVLMNRLMATYSKSASVIFAAMHAPPQQPEAYPSFVVEMDIVSQVRINCLDASLSQRRPGGASPLNIVPLSPPLL